MTSPDPTPAPASLPSRAASALGDIKIAHSVFALPFALLGAFLATPAIHQSAPPGAWRRLGAQLALVVACMVAARTWAMLVNRIADRRFDAQNERTRRRAIPSGRSTARAALAVALASAALFIACCAMFLALGNPWPLALSVPVLAWIALYSYTKRFTALCHLFLGSALALSPLAAALAVHPPALAHTPALYPLAAMVMLWVAGFDVLYALQDTEFDRSNALHSIPARLGARRAAWASRALHALALVALLAAWRLEPRFQLPFLLAAIGVGALLAAEHAIVARQGLRGLPLAFGLLNGIVSVVLGAVGIADLIG